MKKTMTDRQLTDYYRRQLGLDPRRAPRRHRSDDATPLQQWLRDPGRQARRWWRRQQQQARRWLRLDSPGPKRRRQRRQRRRRADLRLAVSPVVQTFLAGASVREATYRHRASDPALLAAGDWPGQVAAAESCIRAHILLLAEEIDALRQQLAGQSEEA